MLNKGYILDDKYEVIDVLGKGGMSTVYLCKNVRLGNLWAIKEIKKDMRDQVDFLTEPNILKDLRHPSIPRIVDIFYKDDSLYMVEDYIEGETLEKLVERKGNLSNEEAVSIALKLCEVLGYLHSFDPPIIYRDLKPSNVIIKQNKDVILIDFGISRLYKENEAHDTIYMGSKGYAAPEQYGSEQSDIQTDIYGLGAIIYFMVNRRSPLNLIEALKDESYEVGVESALRKIIKKAMEIEKSKRYLNIGDMKDKLSDFLYKNQDKTVILKQYTEKEDEKTKILSRKEKTRGLPKRGKIYKNVSILITCLAILFLCINIINKSSYNSESITKDNSKYKTSITKIEDKQDNTKELKEVKNVIEDKDKITQGILYKNNPIVLEKSSDEVDKKGKANGKSKGKNKEKDKDDEKEDDYSNNLVYKLNPAASTSKYYNKFISRIEYIQFIEDKLVMYIITEDNTGENTIIDTEEGLYLSNDKGESIKGEEIIRISSSNNSSDKKVNSFKVVFENPDWDTESLMLKAYTNNESEEYSKEIKMLIKILETAKN